MNIDEPVPGAFVLPGRGRHRHRRSESQFSNRVPLLKLLPKSTRRHFVAMCGEFTGTFLFLFFAFSGTQVANTQNQVTLPGSSSPSQLLYISLCFGFSLSVNAWVFFRISGGLFNPAVTFGMCLVGALPYIRGGLLVVSQLLGAISSAAVVSALFPGQLNVQTSLGAGTSIIQGVFIEMFLTAQLVFTIFMLAAEKHKATFIAPVGIGLSLFIAELTGVFYTGGSLNPARSLAPCVVLRSFEGYHWIYWVGPVLGMLLASGFYKFMKMLEYETANPGQDSGEKEETKSNPKVNAKYTAAAFENGELPDHAHASHHFKNKPGERYYHADETAPIGNNKAGGGRHPTFSPKVAGNGEDFSPAGNARLMTRHEVFKDAFKDGPFAEAGLVSPRPEERSQRYPEASSAGKVELTGGTPAFMTR